MAHADRIWPALACLRRGELPSPAEVDALVALARGECEAPRQPRLFTDSDGADALAREWYAAYEAEHLCPPPSLSPSARSALKGAERDMPGASKFYGWFFKWILEAGKSAPKWAGSISPQPAKFRERLAEVAAWAGPRIAAQRKAERDRAEVERAERREHAAPTAEGVAVPPPGGFAALRNRLAAAKAWGGGE